MAGEYAVPPHSHLGQGDGGEIQQISDPYTDEKARDAIGTALTEGSNITITVDDANDTITIAAADQTAAEYPADDGSDLTKHTAGRAQSTDLNLINITSGGGRLVSAVAFMESYTADDFTTAGFEVTVDGATAYEINGPYVASDNQAVLVCPRVKFDTSLRLDILSSGNPWITGVAYTL